MTGSNLQNKIFMINSSRSWYFQVLGVSAFIPVLNIISGLWTHTAITITTLYLFFGTFIFFIAIGARTIKVTSEYVRYYSYTFFRKTVSLKAIDSVNIEVVKRYTQNGPSASPTMYLIGFDSKKLATLALSTFDNRDVDSLIQKIRIFNPAIKFNGKAEKMGKGHLDDIDKEIKGVYFGSIYIIFLIILVCLIVLGLRFLLH